MDGETRPVLAIPDFCDDLEGHYCCHVANAAGTVVSRQVRVTARR